MQELIKKIGYEFKNENLLTNALSHTSYANEKKLQSYERLEFLGDSVLSFIVSKYIFIHYKKLPEGELTKMRSGLVCEKALAEFAKKLDLGEHLLLGHGEEATGGRQRQSIIADVFEAIIAAIFLDGGIKAAEKFVLEFIKDELSDGFRTDDYKTLLQEVIQRNRDEKIAYALTGTVGPDHDRTFEVSVFLNSNEIGKGKGRTKKQAEQNAAKEALILMGYEE